MSDIDHVDDNPDVYDGLDDMAKAHASAHSSSWSSSFLEQEFEAVVFPS
jgi:hypothetical protein